MTKVITEERLRELLLEVSQLHGTEYSTIEKLILYECHEIDQLTVTKLRPMSEAPTEEDDEFLVKIKGKEKLSFVVIFQGQVIDQYSDWVDPRKLEGWLPITTYKPEKQEG